MGYMLEERRSAVESTTPAVDERLLAAEVSLFNVDGELPSFEKRSSAVDERVFAVDSRLSAVDERLSTVDEKISELDNVKSSLSPMVEEECESGIGFRSKLVDKASSGFEEVSKPDWRIGSRASSKDMPSFFTVADPMVEGIAYETAVGEMAMKVMPRPRRK